MLAACHDDDDEEDKLFSLTVSLDAVDPHPTLYSHNHNDINNNGTTNAYSNKIKYKTHAECNTGGLCSSGTNGFIKF